MPCMPCLALLCVWGLHAMRWAHPLDVMYVRAADLRGVHCAVWQALPGLVADGCGFTISRVLGRPFQPGGGGGGGKAEGSNKVPIMEGHRKQDRKARGEVTPSKAKRSKGKHEERERREGKKSKSRTSSGEKKSSSSSRRRKSEAGIGEDKVCTLWIDACLYVDPYG